MNWTSAEDIINKILPSKSPSIKDAIESAWNEFEYSEYADIVTCKDGELLLKVKNSAYLHVLNMKREVIKESLNSRTGENIKNIKFCLGG